MLLILSKHVRTLSPIGIVGNDVGEVPSTVSARVRGAWYLSHFKTMRRENPASLTYFPHRPQSTGIDRSQSHSACGQEFSGILGQVGNPPHSVPH